MTLNHLLINIPAIRGTAPVSGPPPEVPVNATPPTFSLNGMDAPQPGFAFTVTQGTWTGVVDYRTLTVRHGSDDSVVATGGSSYTYYPTEADVGETLYVREVATNGGGSSTPAESAETDEVMELGFKPFHPHAFWNQAIPGDATVRSDSATLITNILDNGGEGPADTNIDGINNGWSCPIYLGSSSSTHVRVYDDTNPSKYIDMPKEPTWHPAADDDHKYMAIEQDTGYVYSVWDLRYRDLGAGAGFQWYSGWGSFGAYKYGPLGDSYTGHLAQPSNGGWGGRATSWPYLGGLILPGEMEAGVIEHALAFIVPGQVCRPSVYKFPAKATDGYSEDGASSIQEGMRVRLNPAYDITGYTAAQQVVLQCMKTYGMWLGDTGSLNGVNARMFMNGDGSGTDSTNWTGLLSPGDFPTDVLDNLQVLDDPDPADIYIEGTPVVSSAPTISDMTPTEDVQLTVTQAVWDRYVDTRALQLRYVSDETVIASGSATFTYTPDADDVGETLYAREVGTSGGNASSPAESADTSAVSGGSLPTPRIWLDPSDTATTFQDSAKTTPATTNGTPVGGVEDKGSVDASISASGAARPLLAAAVQNGLNGLTFSGGESFAVTGYTLAAADHYFAIVVIPNAGNLTGSQYFMDVETGRFTIMHASPDTSGWLGFGDGAGHDVAANASGAQLLEFILINGTGTASVLRNGVQIGSAQNFDDKAIGGQVAIGSRYSRDDARLDATLCEFRDYSPAPTSGERATIRAALISKWGIS
jgi:hypothetical protein